MVNEPGGTAFLSKSKLTVLSGKTGTAQVRAFTDIMKSKCENMEVKDRHHAWFVGYAPRENPQIAVVAIAEHGCHGSSAGHLVHDVIDKYFEKVAIAEGKALVPETPKVEVEKPAKKVPAVKAEQDEE